ncbi:MAG TPA: HAMP domain-containing sensor histidine kinase [Rhodocyclaceae bacterium]|nr:HAMP domain-containing sensor histidine kinase [Rhodocyclaceae bacterium]
MTLFLPITGFATRLALQWRRPLLVAVLVLLYPVLLLGAVNPLARTLFVVHLGLFILWQPVVRADQRIGPTALALMLTAVAAVSFGLNGWLLTFWIALLAGVVGGKVFLFEARWTKLFFLFALFWLVAALLLLALPTALPQGISSGPTVRAIGQWALPAVIVLMLLLPERREADGQPEVIDFVYSVIVVLLLAVLILGSLALMLLLGHRYVEALLETLLVIGLALLVLGWVWNPHLGMVGVGTVFSRHLMSIGMPVEQWLHTLADLAQRQQDPDGFVAEACGDMVRRLPWVTGVEWEAEVAGGSSGDARGRCSEFTFDALTVRIYTRYPLGPSLAWHFNLLAQLIAEFRADKLRARQLKRLSYLEAIHETGARLTHDVKNLLQSLRTLCTAAQGESGNVPPQFVALLRRQLPAITSRLGQTLDKLQEPRLESDERVAVGSWWDKLRSRYASAGIRFTAEGDLHGSVMVPAALFNHVVENLLANALDKRATSTTLQVAATLRIAGADVSVDVCDDGAPLPPMLAADVFLGPVPSETGMGIGLYQASRLLENSGFRMMLATNEPGRVCFRVAPATS